MRSSHNFNYLRQRPWSNVFVEILQAEEILDLSPRSCMIFTRTALEKFMKVVYSIDSNYFFSRNKDLFSLINEPDFKNSIKPGLWLKMEELRTLGNSAVHDGEKIYTRETAIGLLKAFYATSLFLFIKYSEEPFFDLQDFKPYLEPIEAQVGSQTMTQVSSANILNPSEQDTPGPRQRKSDYQIKQVSLKQNNVFYKIDSSELLESSSRAIIDSSVHNSFQKATIKMSGTKKWLKSLFRIKRSFLTNKESMELSEMILKSIED